jgi:hypothetical protein
MVTIIAITIATIIKYLSVLSVQASALAFGGDIPGNTAATEEFTGETTAANTKTITTS